MGSFRAGPLDCLVVAAHPDDDVIGAAFLLMRCPRAAVVFLTDGAPREVRFWPTGPGPLEGLRAQGTVAAREGYASLRRREARDALRLCRVGEERIAWLGVVDQEAARGLSTLAKDLAAAVRRRPPRALVAHPYEGGHSDHDSAAFVAHAARALLRREGAELPLLWEMTSYHGRNGQRVTGGFLEPRGAVTVLEPSSKEAELKRQMLACHASQRQVLLGFDAAVERIRVAPVYDFARRPHPGPLYYEQMGFALRSAEWLELAQTALEELALPTCL